MSGVRKKREVGQPFQHWLTDEQGNKKRPATKRNTAANSRIQQIKKKYQMAMQKKNSGTGDGYYREKQINYGIFCDIRLLSNFAKYCPPNVHNPEDGN